MEDRRVYRLTIAYAPIPSGVISPGKMHPLNSRGALWKWLEKEHKAQRGKLLDVEHTVKEDAVALLEAFKPESGTIWVKKLVRTGNREVPSAELHYSNGIKQ